MTDLSIGRMVCPFCEISITDADKYWVLKEDQREHITCRMAYRKGINDLREAVMRMFDKEQ